MPNDTFHGLPDEPCHGELCVKICNFAIEKENQKDIDTVKKFIDELFVKLKPNLDSRRKCLFWRAGLAFRTKNILTAYKLLRDLCDCHGSNSGTGANDPIQKFHDCLLSQIDEEGLEHWLKYCTGRYKSL